MRPVMCEKRGEIDKKIDHYRWLATEVNDERTSKGISELIRQCELEKADLHTDMKEGRLSEPRKDTPTGRFEAIGLWRDT
jgi:hypothetical protein